MIYCSGKFEEFELKNRVIIISASIINSISEKSIVIFVIARRATARITICGVTCRTQIITNFAVSYLSTDSVPRVTKLNCFSKIINCNGEIVTAIKTLQYVQSECFSTCYCYMSVLQRERENLWIKYISDNLKLNNFQDKYV